MKNNILKQGVIVIIILLFLGAGALHGVDGTTENVSSTDAVICGDVNFDGVVNAADIVYMIGMWLPEFPPPPIGCEGDVNCDGAFGAGDVVYLISYLFRGGPPPCTDCCNPPWP